MQSEIVSLVAFTQYFPGLTPFQSASLYIHKDNKIKVLC